MHFCQEENAEKVLKTRIFWTKYGLKTVENSGNARKAFLAVYRIQACISHNLASAFSTGCGFAQVNPAGLSVRDSQQR